ncbi:hypothetical protein CCR75_000299 [Bremia lactucae]|uniref:Kinesin-like protein n=1 Tax=Bremia lactucae TaxID=4779 RepID=A0A976IEA5_BRELC|nr:hypothetical protein CCR75_000299 [Bremia lactucae]
MAEDAVMRTGDLLAKSDAVQVAVRIRPINSNEASQDSESCVEVVDTSVRLAEKQFEFDAAFPAATAQECVFTTLVTPMIDQFFDGYNATVFAYGQTGSGKTYTMGNDFAVNIDQSDRGIIPRVIQNIFEQIGTSSNQQQFIVKLSYLEILNEEIRDLLAIVSSDSKMSSSGLSVRGDGDRGIFVAGLSEHIVQSVDQASKLLRTGALLRATASTSMNSHSSRSHAICTVIMEHHDVKTVEGGLETRYSKFHLVDLAGSERVRRTNSEGARFREGVNINRGLLALGNVINALSERSRTSSTTVHIPYRDSKLTRLLQDSLGGNSKTLMIACISPADVNFEETSSTLRYASRTRNIENRAVINKEWSAENEVLYLKQQLEIVQLQLIQQQQGEANDLNRSDAKASGSVISLLMEENRKLKAELCLANNGKNKGQMMADELIGPSKKMDGEPKPHSRNSSQDLANLLRQEQSESGFKIDEGVHRETKSTHASRWEQLKEFQRQKSFTKESLGQKKSNGSMTLMKRSLTSPSPSLVTSNTERPIHNAAIKPPLPGKSTAEVQSIEAIKSLLYQVMGSQEAIFNAKEAVRANVADRKALALEKSRVEAMSSGEKVEMLSKLQADLHDKTDRIRMLQQQLSSIEKKVSLPSGLLPTKVAICHETIRFLVEMLMESKEECWTLINCRKEQDAAYEKVMAEQEGFSKRILELETTVEELTTKLRDQNSKKTRNKKRKQRESFETMENLFSSSEEEADNNEADSDYVDDELRRTRSSKRNRGSTAINVSKVGDAASDGDKSSNVLCCSCHGKCATKACECKSLCRICSDKCSCKSEKCRNRKNDDMLGGSGGTCGVKLQNGTSDLAITSFVPSTPKRLTGGTAGEVSGTTLST